MWGSILAIQSNLNGCREKTSLLCKCVRYNFPPLAFAPFLLPSFLHLIVLWIMTTNPKIWKPKYPEAHNATQNPDWRKNCFHLCKILQPKISFRFPSGFWGKGSRIGSKNSTLVIHITRFRYTKTHTHTLSLSDRNQKDPFLFGWKH